MLVTLILLLISGAVLPALGGETQFTGRLISRQLGYATHGMASRSSVEVCRSSDKVVTKDAERSASASGELLFPRRTAG